MYNPIYTMMILMIALVILLGVQMYRVMPKDDDARLNLLITRYLDNSESLSTEELKDLHKLVNGKVVNIRMMRGASLVNSYIYDKVLITTIYYDGRFISAEPNVSSEFFIDLLSELRSMRVEHQSDRIVVKYCKYDDMVVGSYGRVEYR